MMSVNIRTASKPATVALAAACTMLGVSWVSQAKAQEAKEASRSESTETLDPMEAWIASTKPSQHHKRLQPLVGEWATRTETFWGGADGPSQITEGKSTKRWALGQRFVEERFEGQFAMPNASGGVDKLTYSGMGLLGYDNYRNLYVGTWADSLSTTILRFTGTMPPTGQALQLYGEMDEPMLKMTGRSVRFETVIVNDDEHRFAIYDLAVDPDYKVIEIKYTRRK